jgi:hypothetical protein
VAREESHGRGRRAWGRLMRLGKVFALLDQFRDCLEVFIPLLTNLILFLWKETKASRERNLGSSPMTDGST